VFHFFVFIYLFIHVYLFTYFISFLLLFYFRQGSKKAQKGNSDSLNIQLGTTITNKAPSPTQTAPVPVPTSSNSSVANSQVCLFVVRLCVFILFFGTAGFLVRRLVCLLSYVCLVAL
jgi:hypothetical protein